MVVGAVDRVEQDRREESVVEYAVGYETTWVVRLPVIRHLQRIAVASFDSIVIQSLTIQLILIIRLHISSVILVEVRELVIEQYRRLQRIRLTESYMTCRCANSVIRIIVSILHVRMRLAPLRHARSRRVLEVLRDLLRGYCMVDRTWRRGVVALRVVYDNLLNFRAGVK